jgi:ABC-type transporter Mla subunit MlaD
MKTQLEQRLKELRAEYESGQKILTDIEQKLVYLENRKKNLNETLLRISGAVELLEELLEESGEAPSPETSTTAGSPAPADPEKNMEVPTVLRKPLEKAREILVAAGLSVGEVTEKRGILPVGVINGDVIRQAPMPGEAVAKGSPVNLIVAVKGKILPSDGDRSYCGAFTDNG